MSELKMRQPMPKWRCRFCGAPVGILGNWLAYWFGTRSHGCDFSNVIHPRETP
jgi:hypothetical protein